MKKNVCASILQAGPKRSNGPWSLVYFTLTLLTAGSAWLAQGAAPPTISDFSPQAGPVGTKVTVHGQNLTDVSAVQFQGVDAPFTPLDDTELLATVPAGAGNGAITVITPGGVANSSAVFVVTVLPPPQITGFSPASGPVGSTVSIEGTNLTTTSSDTTTVRFNGVSADFTFLGNTISATVPAGATSGFITVRTLGGSTTSATLFEVTQPGAPTIDGFTPDRGGPGTTVSITGANLDTVTAVSFNGVPAPFQYFGTILATVPTNAQSGPISLTNPRGTATSATAFTFINPLAPVISSLSTSVGDAGTSITLNGTNFLGTTQISFDGVNAPVFFVFSDSQVVVTVPAGASSGPISLTTPKGTAVSSDIFYVSAKLLSFEPSSGPAGTTVTIHGSNFTGATDVLFGPGRASFTNVSAVEIRAVVPPDATSGAISVATPAGFVQSATDFYLPPRVAGFNPGSGLAGTTVMLTGENFLGVTNVQFGGSEASFTPVSLTLLSTVVPDGAKDGAITVSTPGGSASSAEPFRVGLFNDLAVVITSTPASVSVGDLLQYTIAVTNNAAVEATHVVLTEQLPSGVNLVFPPSNPNCVQTGNVITCNFDTVAYGMDVSIKLFASVMQGPYLTNQAQVTSAGADSNPANNSASLLTVLAGAPPPPDTNTVSVSARLSGSSLWISWPASAEAFALQTATSLSPPIAWSPVPDVPAVANGTNTVSQAVSAGARFYRLQKP